MTPLTQKEAGSRLAALTQARGIVLAVSGGPDSIALMYLAAAFGRDMTLPPISVGTVDHGLRAGSERIAADVARRAAELGFGARVLPWEGRKPVGGIQDAARDARYRLLTAYAHEVGASHLITAHTLDDQAETILFRLIRGSGLAGLGGMRDVIMRGTIIHQRPFLDIPKARLVAACRTEGWEFSEDPANQDPRFARARMRLLLPLLADEGLDAMGLATLARRLARADEAITIKAETALSASRISAEPGRHVFAAARLFEEPTAVFQRALELALKDLIQVGAPRLGRLESLVDALEQSFRNGEPQRRTLHGAIVSLRRDGTLELVEEPERRRGTMRFAAETGSGEG